jgi:hypothetical protein
MKRTELRIGNLVERNGKIHEVSSIHADDTIRLFVKNGNYSFGCFTLKEINPMPLTEEWLLKFGFEITDNFQTKDRFQTHKQDGIIWFEYGYIVVELNYVHQLQNLYFSLTGEELTIKN